MWWWHGGGAWAWLLMTVGMATFWGLVVWAVVSVVRGQSRSELLEDPASTLARRLARGEIDEEQYHRLLSAVRDASART